MRLERAVDIQIELKARVNDLIGLAVTCHLPHSDMTERYLKLFERYPKDLPGHVRSYIRGYYEARIDSLYHTSLQYGYEWENLVYPANWDTLPEPLKEACRKGAVMNHGHYWKETIGNPSSGAKPFFVNCEAV